MTNIKKIEVRGARFRLPRAAGTDAVHSGSEYACAVTLLKGDKGATGSSIVLTLGKGNELVCDAIRFLSKPLLGREIEELMAEFGAISHQLADHPQLRWLGPHKGVVQLALASITNACFDLWAKSRGVPLWRLLLDLSPEQIVGLLDLSYLEDALTPVDALAIVKAEQPNRAGRESVLKEGCPGYDTSVGWFQYGDQQIKENALRALEEGFRAFKLKVGSTQGERDIRRASLLRQALGPDVRIMLDVNQQWSLPRAIQMCRALSAMSPYWITESFSTPAAQRKAECEIAELHKYQQRSRALVEVNENICRQRPIPKEKEAREQEKTAEAIQREVAQEVESLPAGNRNQATDGKTKLRNNVTSRCESYTASVTSHPCGTATLVVPLYCRGSVAGRRQTRSARQQGWQHPGLRPRLPRRRSLRSRARISGPRPQ